jgi:azurin
MRMRTTLATIALALAAVPSSAGAQAVVTLPASDIYGFLPPNVVVTAATDAMLINIDPIASPAGAPHDVRSTATRATKNRPWCVNFPGTAKCPMLYTPLIGPGETAVIQGIADLTPGVEYEFFCTAHVSSMRGTITVVA